MARAKLKLVHRLIEIVISLYIINRKQPAEPSIAGVRTDKSQKLGRHRGCRIAHSSVVSRAIPHGTITLTRYKTRSEKCDEAHIFTELYYVLGEIFRARHDRVWKFFFQKYRVNHI